MAYNNGLLNFGDSYVEVGYNNEDYSVDKAQIVEKDGTVHELGGGGGDYPILTSTWHDDTESYTYSCDWSFTKLKAKIEGLTLPRVWAGILADAAYDSTMGGSWIINGAMLTFTDADGARYNYNNDGTIVEEA